MRGIFSSLALLATISLTSAASQISFSDSSSGVSTASLSSLSSEYTVLSHPSFPKQSARIRKNPDDWCDPSVASYSGWIDTTAARHYFFYFFESRSSPEEDDVVMWTNGGPGGSSAIGLFMELGPCRVVSVNETKVNPHSWNEKSNIFFIDQPVGVGFSYADYNETVSSTEEASEDIAAFIAIFFQTFSSFKGREFHLSGESYAGRYLPVYASTIYDQNAKLVKQGIEPINLKSVLIGNGYTNAYEIMSSYYDIMCTNASVEPFVDISSCVRMKTALPRIQAAIQRSCIDTFDAINCQAAQLFHSAEVMLPFLAAGRNRFDVSKPCSYGTTHPDGTCYDLIDVVEDYLNNPATRKTLGLPKDPPIVLSSRAVADQFESTMDIIRVQTQFYLENLLDRGVRVLIYVGTYDLACNWVGNLRTVDAMEWSRSTEFGKQRLEAWSAKDGKSRAGQFKSGGGLTFLTIEGAGHLVPYDKPVESLEMLKRWLGGGKEF